MKRLRKKESVSEKVSEIETYTEQDKQVLNYIQQSFDFFFKDKKKPIDWHYKGQYDFILQHAKFYKSQQLTEEERKIVNDALKNLHFKPRMKECFYNAQMLALADTSKKIQYCEGFGLFIIPMNHGWCVLNDKVIDITWKDDGSSQNIFGTFDKSYFGFTLPNEMILKKQFATGMAVSFLDDWKGGWELFKKPFKQ